MSPAKILPLVQRLRSLTPDRQIEAIADDVDGIRHDVDGLRVLASAGVEAQRATGDALALMADRLGTVTATQREHGESLADLGSTAIATETSVASLVESIGAAPDPKALAHASSLDLSPEAIRKAELGSGLRRDVAELRVALAGLGRKIGAGVLGVATAASVLPAVFAALPGAAQVASGVVLALVTGLAGVWASRKKAPPALPPKEG